MLKSLNLNHTSLINPNILGDCYRIFRFHLNLLEKIKTKKREKHRHKHEKQSKSQQYPFIFCSLTLENHASALEFGPAQRLAAQVMDPTPAPVLQQLFSRVVIA
jgi:hypothetical protein